ncbi:MAG: nucleotide exchange factor GrpE [Candidatus Methylomirabilales bacterium]
MSEERSQEELESGEERQAAPVAEGAGPPDEAAGGENLSQGMTAQAHELQELQDRYLRLAADFDNYRKRVMRERAELIRTAHEGLLLEFLPVLDNLERALAAARSSAASSQANETLIEGVEITLRLFKGVLEKEGVKAIETVGRPFDPTVHHAVEQVRATDHPENTVVEEVLRGYLLNQKVLRPALVKVSTDVAASVEAEGRSEGRGGE